MGGTANEGDVPGRVASFRPMFRARRPLAKFMSWKKSPEKMVLFIELCEVFGRDLAWLRWVRDIFHGPPEINNEWLYLGEELLGVVNVIRSTLLGSSINRGI